MANNKRVIIEVARRGPAGVVTSEIAEGIVGPLVDAHIASDPTFSAAASDAVDAEIAGRPILEGGTILEDDIAFAVVDEDGRRTWLEAGMDGGLTSHSVSKISEHISGAQQANMEADSLSFAVVDEDGRRTWIEADAAGGPTMRTLSLISAGLSIEQAATSQPELSTVTRSLAKLLANYYFVDDFNRANTTGGTSPTVNGLGNGWTVSADYTTTRIEDGSIRSDANMYAYQVLPFTPQRVAALARFPTADARSVTFLTSPASTLHHDAVHVVFTANTCFIQVRQSSATTTLNTIALNLTLNQQYELAVEISGTAIIAYVDGREVGRGTHANVPTLNGPYATWQQGPTGGAPLACPYIDMVDAVGPALS